MANRWTLGLILFSAACGGDKKPYEPPPADVEAIRPFRAFGYDTHVFGQWRLFSVDSVIYGGATTLTLRAPDDSLLAGPGDIATIVDTAWGTFRLIDSTVVPPVDTVLALWLWAPGTDYFGYTRRANEEFIVITPPKNPTHGLFFALWSFWRPPTIISLWTYSGTDAQQNVVARLGGDPLAAPAAFRAPLARCLPREALHGMLGAIKRSQGAAVGGISQALVERAICP